VVRLHSLCLCSRAAAWWHCVSDPSACAGACTGDGAGCMVAIPHEFFKRVVREACGVRLPAAGEYAVMMAFLPKEPEQYHSAKGTIAKCAQT